MKPLLHKLGLVLAALLLIAAPAAADSPQTGTVEGTVTDAAAGPLPGVTVTLASDRGAQTAVTGEDGTFRFGLLQPGDYTVGASLEGFRGAEQAVHVDSGGRSAVTLKLGLETGEAITITSEAPLVNKFEVATVATLESEVADDLSFNSRNYQSVTYMMPGVVQSSNSQNLGDHRPGINGSNWQENAAFIDGVDTSNTRRGGSSRIFLPTTALAEVRMDGSAYGAEYGRVTGGVTGVITKSGTNQFHGDFLYIAQNEDWRAQSDAVPIDRDDDIHNSYEAGLGGPIVRDKAWFFVAGADNTTNEIDITRDGTIVDASLYSESILGKINFQPTSRHAFAVTYVDAPAEKPLTTPNFGDIYTIPLFKLGGDFTTASWNFSAADDKFLELRGAMQSSTEDREQTQFRELDPTKSIHTPLNNHGKWQDQATTFQWNAFGPPLGAGNVDFPRDQVNAAFTWFVPSNELKFGVDWQDVAWETLNNPPDLFIGRNYNPNLPGGFVNPTTAVMRVFIPSDGVIKTSSEAIAGYVQDRITIGDHWAFNVGLRYEDQSHDNDIGEELVQSSDLAPRFAVTYDIGGDGKLLIKGTAGRYYQHIAQNIINEDGATKSNGANSFQEFGWNPATQLYDRLLRTVLPNLNTDFQDIDPYHKDEVTAGVEWQVSPSWAFKARGMYWKLDDLFWATDQITPAGVIVHTVQNFPEGERDYNGLQLEMNRSFRDGWVLRSNYTLSRAEGNVFGNNLNTVDDDDFLEARRAINPATGQPYTADFRDGRSPLDREHILNVAGAKNWEVGRHTFTLGGLAWYRSGERWGNRPQFTVNTTVVPNIQGTIQTTRYIEPRDLRSLPDTMMLNLNGGWTFPLWKSLEGTLRAEVANVTDEQEEIAVNLATGQVIQARASFQNPREVRLVAGLKF
jgi:hypothetical protein